MDAKLVSWGTATASVAEKDCTVLSRSPNLFIPLKLESVARDTISLFASHDAAPSSPIKTSY